MQAKVSKVLNLDFYFFDRLTWQIKKNVTIFISKQDQKFVFIKFMHYPKQDERVISSYHVDVKKVYFKK